MGGCSTHLSPGPSGKLDLKAACDDLINGEVLKSAMIGHTWYGAYRKDGIVSAAVISVSIDNSYWENFCYRSTPETWGPYQIECPDSILDILDPTDDKDALEWRSKCRERNRRVKELRNLPFGSVVCWNGYEFVKTTHRGKNLLWVDYGKNCRISQAKLARDGYTLKTRKGE